MPPPQSGISMTIRVFKHPGKRPMPKFDSPLLLSPVFKPKIWGRDDLNPIFACPRTPISSKESDSQASPTQARRKELIGEVWITDDESRFLNGPLAGLTLAEASKKYGAELHGSAWKDDRFPILAKYIYTSDWLSVQVHPGDDYARVHDPGNRGKCEMWYIVHAYRGAKILSGVKRGVTPEMLRVAFERGASRGLLNQFRPRPGEAIFVPPGTVHALGAGLVLFEVEENSDLTYRLDDFGRLGLDGKPRPLHLDKGFDVMTIEMPAGRDGPRLTFREPYGTRRYVLACRFFALEELRLKKTAIFHGTPERVEVFSLLEGEGRLENEAGWLGYRAGDTWLIPPAAAPFRMVPGVRTRLLKFYVPDLERDFIGPLRKRGARPAKLKKIIFD